MRFAHKLTLVILLLLCATLSAGGAWTLRQNFSRVLQTAELEATRNHLWQRFALEDRLQQADGTDPAQVAAVAMNYAYQRRRSAGISGEYFTILEGTGSILYSNLPDSAPFRDQWQLLQAGAGSLAYCGDATARYLLLASPLQCDAQGLWLVSGYDVTAAFSEHRRQLRQHLALEAVALLAAGMAAALAAGALTRPLRRLQAASRALAAGQYGQPVEVAGHDEVGELAQSFHAMAQTVNRSMEELRRQADSRTRFVVAFTHELKTPMTAILGYADLLRSGEQPAGLQQRAANYIYHESARLEALSRQLLLLLGLQQGEAPALAPEPVAALFADVLRTLPSLDVTVEHICPPGAAVVCNRVLLADLLRNLVLNAAAASPAGGKVLLCCTQCPAGWRLAVQDWGCGIPAGDLPHVTEAFYMVDKSRSRTQGGSGLGLSLCAEIARAHHTALSLESAPGQGTTAWLELPCREVTV